MSLSLVSSIGFIVLLFTTGGITSGVMLRIVVGGITFGYAFLYASFLELSKKHTDQRSYVNRFMFANNIILSFFCVFAIVIGVVDIVSDVLPGLLVIAAGVFLFAFTLKLSIAALQQNNRIKNLSVLSLIGIPSTVIGSIMAILPADVARNGWQFATSMRQLYFMVLCLAPGLWCGLVCFMCIRIGGIKIVTRQAAKV